jgi:hypothetical protein
MKHSGETFTPIHEIFRPVLIGVVAVQIVTMLHNNIIIQAG